MSRTLKIKVLEGKSREVTLTIGKDISEKEVEKLIYVLGEETSCDEDSELYNMLKQYVGSNNYVQTGYTNIEVYQIDSSC